MTPRTSSMEVPSSMTMTAPEPIMDPARQRDVAIQREVDLIGAGGSGPTSRPG